jgi:YhcH/YjgK/YiaL family protein
VPPRRNTGEWNAAKGIRNIIGRPNDRKELLRGTTMILDRLENAAKYFPLHKRLARAFEYLSRTDCATLPDGRHEIDGPRIYLLMAHAPGRGRQGMKLEAHRRYIDVQIPLDAPEEMGWREAVSCRSVSQAYQEKGDIEFFADAPACWITVEPGCFALFFPHDAHAPLACTGLIHKAIVKIAVD